MENSNETAVWVDRSTASQLTGLSVSTPKAYRRSGKLREGIHYVALGVQKYVYNRALLLDWLANRASPELHEFAIRAFLESLASSQAIAATSTATRRPQAERIAAEAEEPPCAS